MHSQLVLRPHGQFQGKPQQCHEELGSQSVPPGAWLHLNLLRTHHSLLGQQHDTLHKGQQNSPHLHKGNNSQGQGVRLTVEIHRTSV